MYSTETHSIHTVQYSTVCMLCVSRKLLYIIINDRKTALEMEKAIWDQERQKLLLSIKTLENNSSIMSEKYVLATKISPVQFMI